MVTVIGVRFRDNGKIYYFSAGELEVNVGDNVIVETARGVEYGKVVFGNREVEEKKIVSNLKQVIRIATEEDDRMNEANHEKSREAFRICQEKIAKHGLEMKLMDCEYTFDNNKVLFYFTADGRIDFRELVKDLASVFKTRIELRQIGVRDETKIMGGIGICGRSLCCHTFLSEFVPVSIKMAKEQNLSLNPTKISGLCGRLMCCLKNEQDTYEYLNSKMPRNGEEIITPRGEKGVVHATNVLRQRVKVLITRENDEKEIEEYSVDDLTICHGGKKKDKVSKIGNEPMLTSKEGETAPGEKTEVNPKKNENRRSEKKNNRNNRRNSKGTHKNEEIEKKNEKAEIRSSETDRTRRDSEKSQNGGKSQRRNNSRRRNRRNDGSKKTERSGKEAVQRESKGKYDSVRKENLRREGKNRNESGKNHE